MELNLGSGFINPATLQTPQDYANAVFTGAAAIIANVVAEAAAANSTLAGLYSGPTGPTPDVGGVTVYVAQDNAAVTISGFTSGSIANSPVVGFPMQRFWLCTNGNQTLQNSSSLRTLAGADVTPTANTYMLFQCVAGTWTQTH